MATTTIPATYKSYVYEKWGPVEDVIQIKDIATAPLPADHVRVHVRSAALNPADYKLAEINRLLFTTVPPSAENPYRIGMDVTGVVVEVGSVAADKFKVGDEVYADANVQCWGSLAEYLSLDIAVVTPKPKNLDFNHAAGVPLVSLTSYQALHEHAQTKTGERVLILGGSSATGIFAIQYAEAIGTFVVATASKKNAEFVKALGADLVVDYSSEKWGEVLEAHSVDVIYDCVGEAKAWEEGAQAVLKKDTGRFVTIAGGPPSVVAKFGASHKSIMTRPNATDLAVITELVESGKVKSFVDSVFPFDKTVDAFLRLKTGRAVGKVVVQISE